MKKALIAALVLLTAVFGTACGESTDDSAAEESAVVIQITSREAAETKGEEIEEVPVKKATKPNENTTDPTDATEAKTTKKKKKKSKTVPTQGDVVPNTYVQVTTAPNGSFDNSDLDFIFEGAYIYLNDDIEDARAILGDDEAANELSKTKTEYEFNGVNIITYESDEIEKIEQITIISDKLTTKKGAKVGMYGTQLRTVYGIPTKKSDTNYTYTKDDKSLIFNIENNIVTSYSYKLNR
ncbi:MAG: hypothetical protein IJ725_01980 [Ruminococcus sp.]|nr:hypothetical protein [Ruminococcus sp.]